MDRAELAAWLRLDVTPGVGRHSARKLLAAFGLPQAVLDASGAARAQVAGTSAADALAIPPPGFDKLLDTTWAWLNEAEPGGAARRIATLGDAHYPAALLNIEDPPLMLYLLGQELPGPRTPAIAIVGTRHPTPQGLQDAHAFARHFAQSGMTVVSGLAQGIDGAAHEGALDGALPDAPCATVAFVGTGLDRVYPRQHRALAHRIAAGGCLVSEYALGTPPVAHNFPRRNRLISGLTLGTLVVEATQPSGSLITARVAAEQGKEVFAIPGSIHAPQSRGCHALIRQGAKLVESAQDVLEELRLPSASVHAATAQAPGEDDSAGPDPLLEAIGHAPVSVDALVARTGIAAAQIQVQLLELELDGRIARLTGGLVQRLASA
ncbi:DNA-protecting protein DprA [Xylophilus rhododendri]|uniref:DNA-protecting protein DprA n=1 Tax=Xylophilus rhododendri TaxID=2697032 RepID=A0A857J7G8_9BURK|nr:DNA-processing protein DprA [Xylophilus rhododendri]QHI98735.1 DNA-protecting protein DprA [Xylophilus rhododendri]